MPPSHASPPIQVRPHPSKLRALYATRALSPGQTIHIFAEPLLLHPTLAHLPSVCAHCLRPGRPRACSRCRAAYYCGEVCQRAGWRGVHARECRALRGRPGGERLPTLVRVLLQALLRGEVEEGLRGLQGVVGGFGFGAARERSLDLEMMARAACAFAGREGEGDVRRGVELLGKIQTNAFHRFDADLADQVGIFLEPTLAMANHSCVPNATVLFLGRRAVLRAERAIGEGDEIEISYTDYTNPLPRRRAALLGYGFTCTCPRCEDDLNVYRVCAQQANGNDNDALDASCSVLGSNAPELRHHPGATDPRRVRLAKEFCAESSPDDELTAGSLRARLAGCQPLVEKELWAVSPVPQVLTDVSLYYVREQADQANAHACAVVVAAVVAVECDPYRYPAAFHVVRLKNLLLVVRLLALTAEEAAAAGRQALCRKKEPSEDDLEAEIRGALSEMDQVSLSQMLLLMVLEASPRGAAGAGAKSLDGWTLGEQARELHDDIMRLEGREKELSLIRAWRAEPRSESSRMFFEYAVVQQMGVLAGLGKRVIGRWWMGGGVNAM